MGASDSIVPEEEAAAAAAVPVIVDLVAVVTCLGDSFEDDAAMMTDDDKADRESKLSNLRLTDNPPQQMRNTQTKRIRQGIQQDEKRGFRGGR
jgi:hypothetical protein